MAFRRAALMLLWCTLPLALVGCLAGNAECSGACVGEVGGAPNPAGPSAGEARPVLRHQTASDQKQLTRFTVLGLDATIGSSDLRLQLPEGTDLSALSPTVEFEGASVSPASGQAANFSSPVVYTVTAADGTRRAYTATVTAAPSSAKAITRFTVLGVDGTITGRSIVVALPAGTSLSNLTPTLQFTGASVNPPSGVAQNFSDLVPYVVTAADGSTVSYTVLVTVAGTDAIDLGQVSVYNSPTDVAGWAVTTTITRLQMQSAGGAGLSFVFPAQGTWPDYTPPGWDGPLQYTVWAVMNINGQWCTSGFIQMWNGRPNTGAPLLTDFAINWAYDGRWGPLMGHQPQVGELVGFFVTAGNARGVPDVTSLRERSNVVMVALPAGDDGDFNF